MKLTFNSVTGAWELQGLDKKQDLTTLKKLKKSREMNRRKIDTDLRTESKSLEVLDQVGEERKTLSLLQESLTS